MSKRLPAVLVATVLLALMLVSAARAAESAIEEGAEWLLEILLHDSTRSYACFMLSRNATAPSGFWEAKGRRFIYEGPAFATITPNPFKPDDVLTIEEIIGRIHGKGELLIVVAERDAAGDIDADFEIGIRTITNIDVGRTWVAQGLDRFVPIDVSALRAEGDYSGFQLPPGAKHMEIWLIPGPPGDYLVQVVMEYRSKEETHRIHQSVLLGARSPRMWP